MNETFTPMTADQINALLPDFSDTGYSVLTGPVAVDLFDHESSVGHRTYRYGDHFYTGVETYDGAEICSDVCLQKWVAEHMADAVELTTDVEHGWQHHEASTWLIPGDDDGVGAYDAVAYPFSHDAHGYAVCAVCLRVMGVDEDADRFLDFVQEAFSSYLETALWSSTFPASDDGRPLDDVYDVSDLSDDVRSELLDDVVNFVAANWSDVMTLSPTSVGHDFWLTRNRHGAGFWDRGLGDAGRRLTDASYAYGEVMLDVGDDGEIYVS